MGEQFYINYSLNGEHYAMGPYHTRRFAMSHIEDVRRQAGALGDNVALIQPADFGAKPIDLSHLKFDDISPAFWSKINSEAWLSRKARGFAAL